jgi:hypothetical protein
MSSSFFIVEARRNSAAKEKGHSRDRNPLFSLEPAGGIEPSILADYESDWAGEFIELFQYVNETCMQVVCRRSEASKATQITLDSRIRYSVMRQILDGHPIRGTQEPQDGT